ncbi:hypothetical protein J3F84DRAFT_368815 [Trichoderma pleuroticola]
MSPPCSIPPVVAHQFMKKTPSHALLFIFLRVPSAISGLSRLWSPGQPEIGLHLLGSERRLTLQSALYLMCTNKMHPARQNDLHEHEPASRLDWI